MRKIQNTNISFRATADFRDKLTHFCEHNDLHNSMVIRQAVNEFLIENSNEHEGPHNSAIRASYPQGGDLNHRRVIDRMDKKSKKLNDSHDE